MKEEIYFEKKLVEIEVVAVVVEAAEEYGKEVEAEEGVA